MAGLCNQQDSRSFYQPAFIWLGRDKELTGTLAANIPSQLPKRVTSLPLFMCLCDHLFMIWHSSPTTPSTDALTNEVESWPHSFFLLPVCKTYKKLCQYTYEGISLDYFDWAFSSYERFLLLKPTSMESHSNNLMLVLAFVARPKAFSTHWCRILHLYFSKLSLPAIISLQPDFQCCIVYYNTF